MQLTNWLQRVFLRNPDSRIRKACLVTRRGRFALASRQHWLECLETRELLTTVVIDYSLDTNNFFDTQAKKDLLQTAADSLGNRLNDNLLAISLGQSGNTWVAIFDHPGTGDEETFENMMVPADTIIIYAGGRDLPGSTVGQGGPGGFSASGTTEFVNTVAARGQAGALLATETDFSLWGGTITFDTDTDWHFGLTIDGLDSDETDFLSVAQHEIGHLLGIGTSSSWQNQVAGSNFTGAASVASFGGNVPLFGDLSHWDDDTMSNGQVAAMNPILLNGTRALFTSLDDAALSDVGWEVESSGPTLMLANAIEDQNATEDSAFAFAFAENTFVNAAGSLSYTATKSDGSALPSWLTFTSATRTFSGTPLNANVGTLSIIVTATDTSNSATDTFDIIVANTNDTPTVANPIPDRNARVDTAFTFQFAANTFADEDVGDSLAFTATRSNGSALPSWLTFTAQTRTFSGTPLIADLGTLSIRVTATDGSSATVSDTFDLVVTDTNSAPTLANPIADQSATENLAFSFQVPANAFEDVDAGDTLTFTTGTLPSWLTFSATTRTFAGTPSDNDVGPFDIQVTATDVGLAAVSDTFRISILPVNDAPSFTKGPNVVTLGDGVQKTFAGWATNISAGPENEAGQGIDFQITNVTNVALFTVAPTVSSNGTLIYTPKAGAPGTGSSTVTVRVHDSGGVERNGVDRSEPQTFTITLTGLNKAPSFTKGPNQPAPGQPLVLEDSGLRTVTNWATAISPGIGEATIGQVLTFAVANNNNSLFTAQGRPAVSAEGTLTYTLADNANGAATVTVILRDNGLRLGGAAARESSTPQTFQITATPVNDAPSFTKGADQTVLEDAAAQSVTNWATSINRGAANESSQTLTFVVTNNNNSLFATQPTISAAGVLTYRPAANANGSALVTVCLQDNGGIANGGSNTSADQTFTINVTAVNDAPTITVPRVQITNEDTIKLIPAIVVADLDATTLNVTLAVAQGRITLGTVTGLTFQNGTTNGSATVEVQGSKADLNAALATINYLPDQNFNGSDTLTATVSDLGATGTGNVLTASKTVAITVRSVNDVPSFTKGADQIVDDNDGVLAITNWATLLNPVAANESSQTLRFMVTADNRALFATQPAISANGTLTFRPNLEVAGIATVTVRLSDNGGKANGGIDTSAAQTFTITVTDQSFDLTAALLDSGDSVTVLRDGNNLVVRRGSTDLVPPTRVEDVGTLTINGGSGGDSVILDASLNTSGPARFRFNGHIQFNGNAGFDSFDASKYIGTAAKIGVTFDGGDGDDLVQGSGGNDTLTGAAGNDQLSGAKGNDTYRFVDLSTDATDEIDTLIEKGSEGTDTLDFGELTTAVVVDLNSETLLATHAHRTIKTGGTIAAKQAPNFENVIGGSAGDAITGNAAGNGLSGRGGGDMIFGRGGSDTIIGGEGNDLLRGGDLSDTVIGGAGEDNVDGEGGTDKVLGGQGNAARGGNSLSDPGDVIAGLQTEIVEAFSTLFPFE